MVRPGMVGLGLVWSGKVRALRRRKVFFMQNGNGSTGRFNYEEHVQRVREAFPASGLFEGQVIPHEKLEEVLGITRDQSRYLGVVARFAAWQREHGSGLMVVSRKIGVKILPSAENVAQQGKSLKRIGAAIERGYRFDACVRPEKLTPVELGRHDLQRRSLNFLLESMGTANRILVGLPVTESLPQRRIE
jgi:hypothetical protein